MYYLCSENKCADRLCGYSEADLHLCFGIMQKSRFSHDAAHFSNTSLSISDMFVIFLQIDSFVNILVGKKVGESNEETHSDKNQRAISWA